MRCPVCKATRLEPTQLEQDLITHTCSTCGGNYITSQRYFKWLERHKEQLPQRPADQTAKLPVSDSKPGKLCPECGAFLIRHLVGHGIEFHLDRCGRCAGIWLDKNEWEILKSRNLHDDVHMIFSQAWQTQVKREQRTKEYNGFVVGLLDEKLSLHITPEELARLKELKGWLDSHPHSREMYGYLRSTRQE